MDFPFPDKPLYCKWRYSLLLQTSKFYLKLCHSLFKILLPIWCLSMLGKSLKKNWEGRSGVIGNLAMASCVLLIGLSDEFWLILHGSCVIEKVINGPQGFHWSVSAFWSTRGGSSMSTAFKGSFLRRTGQLAVMERKGRSCRVYKSTTKVFSRL